MMDFRSCPCCAWQADEESAESLRVQWTNHRQTQKHTLNYLKYFYNKNRLDLLSNKHDVEISCLEVVVMDLKVVGSVRPRNSCTFTLAITNLGESVHFVSCEFLHKLACCSIISDISGVTADSQRILDIPAGCADPYYVQVEVKPECVGIYQSPLVFQFMRGETPFYMGLEIIVSCSDSIIQALEDTKPYVCRTENNIRPPAVEIFSGVWPKGESDKIHYENHLEDFKLDDFLKKAIEQLQDWFTNYCYVPREDRNKSKLKYSARELYDFLLLQLDKGNYKPYFNLLVNLEEVQMENDIRKYDMKHATMTRSNEDKSLLCLRVMGVAEKRPSVLKGDQVCVRIAKEERDVEYKGIVHRVEENNLLLGFGIELMAKYLPNMKFHVRFVCNKFLIKVMLRALKTVEQNHVNYWLFPNPAFAATCSPINSPTERLLFYNRKIEENPEQKTAIQHIVAGSSLPAPYLLHGPPGTGKTVTLVEAVMQIWKKFNTEPHEAKILICTPSNSASDLITERLLRNIPKHDIFRFYSMSRELKVIPRKIQEGKCFNYNFDKKKFFVPTKRALKEYRIVISTLVNSTKLVSLGFKPGYFTHIFIDEAGHAVEPEAIVPLVGLVKCRQEKDCAFGGQIVLAGDPMQLGPVIRCRVAQEFFFGRSLLERLMKMEVYQRSKGDGDGPAQFNPKLLTRLKNNYRSHPAILRLPNKLFYDDELRVCADELLRNSLCHWEGLPNPKFPVLFHGVQGRDMQEAKNPSYFNSQEVSVVNHYVEWLLTTRNKGINIQPKDIGIISPYRQQVNKIRNELRKKNHGDLTIGSVDEFQGQERRVIIISTVRSNPDLMTYDRKYKLGFLNNPKRLNVALTRAQCLLIVIGNPNLLSKDKYWNEFLRYCRENGSYVGAQYDDPDEEFSDMMDRFRSLHLVPVELEPVRISQRAHQEDPPWRDDY